MNETKGLISSMSKKWKLEQIPSKKLEIENKLMEERLVQLKTELIHDKNKRNAMGGTIWSKAQPGPVTNYGKNVLRTGTEDSLANKLSNRQIKLQVLKEEVLVKRAEKTSTNPNSAKDKKNKCGQCEKNLAFTRCLECGEDYCANCFTSFHMKGALQKHRSVPISNNLNKSASSRPNSEYQNQSYDENMYDTNSYLSGVNSAKENTVVTFNLPDHEENNKKSDSLMDGAYDEREAHLSFQQALLEWRNSKKQEKPVEKITNRPMSNLSSRDAVVGTENQITLVENKGIKQLENHINSNHTLSYAERMLLQKYRRNELELEPGSARSDKNDFNNDQFNANKSIDTINLDDSDHINFNSIVESLKGGKPNEYLYKNDNEFDLNKISYIPPPPPSIIPPAESRLENQTMKKFENTKNSLFIEEVENSLKIKNQNVKSLNWNTDLEIKDLKPNPILIKDNERPASSRFTTPRPNSSRTKSAKPKTQTSMSQSLQLEKNLTREPTNVLKQIANRETPTLLIADDDSKLGNFFMLDVKNENQIIEPRSRVPSAMSRPESVKLSHKFYSMTPRSWNPAQSLGNNLAIDIKLESSKFEDKYEKQTLNTSLEIMNQNLKEDLNKIPEQDSTMNKNSKNSKNTQRIKTPISVSSSLNFNKNKTVSNSPTLDQNYKRNKSFVSSIKTNSKPQVKNNRPASINDYYPRPSSRLNLEFGNKFNEFDIDDGRSSRVCQNEDDNDYFGTLITEFRKSVSSEVAMLSDTTVKIRPNQQQYEQDLRDLNDTLNRGLTNLEISLRNNGYDEDENDELESMTLEELKSLR